MNQQIRDELLWRATIVENAESLIKSCSRNNKDQLSLFSENKNETIELKIPDLVNYEDWIQKESDVLGVALTYNIQDKYILHSKRFCNNTLRSINQLSESQGGIIFIAKIDQIEYKTSLLGNNYARISWKDYDSECNMFLFGDMYQKLISKAFKGRYYLCECSYNKDKESLSIINFRPIEDISIEQYVQTIVLETKTKDDIFNLRNYIFKNMIGSKYNLVFKVREYGNTADGDEFKAPYKINFTEENYCDIKRFINDLTVRK